MTTNPEPGMTYWYSPMQEQSRRTGRELAGSPDDYTFVAGIPYTEGRRNEHGPSNWPDARQVWPPPTQVPGSVMDAFPPFLIIESKQS